MFRIVNLTLPWQTFVAHSVDANTGITYSDNTIKEDLADAENLLDVWETPFLSMIAKDGTASSTNHQWPKLKLQPASSTNRQLEGTDNLPANAADYALRMSNFTQISTKVISVSDTSQWIDGAANIEKIAKQVAYKLKELKMDKETMLLNNVAANPGSASVARVAAGLPAFIITNDSRESTGADPTLSGTTQGYPTTIAGDGALRTITETMLRTVIQSVWSSGGAPKYALVGPSLKNIISTTFTGTATRFKDADSKKLVQAVDIYESDFGTLQIVPDRYSRNRDCLVIDPRYVSIDYGETTRTKDLARTGLSQKKLISCEYTLMVGNEAAHGVVADVQ